MFYKVYYLKDNPEKYLIELDKPISDTTLILKAGFSIEDISAKLDMQEMKNAVIQAQKEIDNRYDFKGISKEIDLNSKDYYIQQSGKFLPGNKYKSYSITTDL